MNERPILFAGPMAISEIMDSETAYKIVMAQPHPHPDCDNKMHGTTWGNLLALAGEYANTPGWMSEANHLSGFAPYD